MVVIPDSDPAAFVDEMRAWLTGVSFEALCEMDQNMTLERWYWGEGPCRLTLTLLDLLIQHHARTADGDRTDEISVVAQDILISLETCLLVNSSGEGAAASRETILGILAIVLDSCAELNDSVVTTACLSSVDSHVLPHAAQLFCQTMLDSTLMVGLLYRLAQRSGALGTLFAQSLTGRLLDTLYAEVLQLEQQSLDGMSRLDLAGMSQVFAQALRVVLQNGDDAGGERFCQTHVEGRLVEMLGIIVGLPPLEAAVADMDDTIAWMYEHCLHLRGDVSPTYNVSSAVPP